MLIKQKEATVPGELIIQWQNMMASGDEKIPNKDHVAKISRMFFFLNAAYAVYSQPFKQNIGIIRISSLVTINVAQIYYEYFGCSFEHQ